MVYCESHITQDDATTSKALTSSNDWRLGGGTGGLYDISWRHAQVPPFERPPTLEDGVMGKSPAVPTRRS